MFIDNRVLSRVIFIFFPFLCIMEGTFEDNAIEHMEDETYFPIILVPGDGGSRAFSIDLSLKRKKLIWFSLEYMFLPSKLRNEFLLYFDPMTGRTRDAKGYQIVFPGWGDTENIENLNTWKYTKTAYFQELVSKLLENPFYIRNKTLRGAPYDFRKSPIENDRFMRKFPKLIEETFERAGNQKVVIVAHSLGCLYSLHFLKNMTTTWKTTYIKSFVATAAPIGGSIKALLLEISGSSFGIPRKPITFRDIERSFSSTAYLLPRPSRFSFKQTLVQTVKKNYTAFDYFELFKDLNFDAGYEMYQSSMKYYDADEALSGISDIHCVHGFNITTPELLKYPDEFPGHYPHVEYGEGDGSVNINSLKACMAWKGVQYLQIANVNHKDILSNHKYIEYIKQIAMQSHN